VLDVRTVLERYVFLDIETTGLDPLHDEIIELGAVFVHEAEIEREVSFLFRPSRPIRPFIEALTGLSNVDLESAPRFSERADVIKELLTGATVVAHNAAFERSFLGPLLDGAELLDSCELALILEPSLESHALSALVSWANIAPAAQHRALDDAKDTFRMVRALLRNTTAAKQAALRAAVPLLGGSPLGRLIEALTQSKPLPEGPSRTETRTSVHHALQPDTSTELSAIVARWARNPGALAIEAETKNIVESVYAGARAGPGAVWLVGARAHRKHLPIPELSAPDGRLSVERLEYLLREAHPPRDCAPASLAYLQQFARHEAVSTASSRGVDALSGFFRGQGFDAIQSFLRSPAISPENVGVWWLSYAHAISWFERSVFPSAAVWFDAPTLLDEERRRRRLRFGLTDVRRLKSTSALGGAALPLSVERAIAPLHIALAAPIDSSDPLVATDFPPLLSALSQALEPWAAPRGQPPSHDARGILADEAARQLRRLRALLEHDPLLWRRHGDDIVFEPAVDECARSLRDLVNGVPSLFVSEVIRPEAWSRMLFGLDAPRRLAHRGHGPVRVHFGLSHAALASEATAADPALPLVTDDALGDEVLGHLVSAARRTGRRVRFHQSRHSDVVVVRWGRHNPAPNLHGPVIVVDMADPLRIRRLLAGGTQIDCVLLSGEVDAPKWTATLGEVNWFGETFERT
jgi:DNA polymerase III epsilon subunit-like protein